MMMRSKWATLGVAVVIACVVSGAVGVADAAETVDVWLLGGQSNMQGRARFSEISEPLPTEIKGAWFWNGKAFVPLAPGRTRTAGRPGEFGPEIGFAAAMASREHPVYLIKYAVSGMPLHHGWHGGKWLGGKPGANRQNFYPGQDRDDPNAGTLYQQMITRFREGLENLRASGKQPRVRGMLWMQGEQDAKQGESATEYAASLRRLRDRVAQDIGEGQGMTIIFGQVLPHEPALPRFTHRQQVRAQMAAADQSSGRPEAIPGAKMVSTDGFGMLPDTVHYNAQGQLKLGRAMAEAAKAKTR